MNSVKNCVDMAGIVSSGRVLNYLREFRGLRETMCKQMLHLEKTFKNILH